jgi:hypothetical protein
LYEKTQHFFFIFCALLVFIVSQSVFAGFSIDVVDKSGENYASVDIVITLVGFGVLSGRLSLGEIGAYQKHFKYFEYNYLNIYTSYRH